MQGTPDYYGDDVDGEGDGWVFQMERATELYSMDEEREAKIIAWRATCFERAGLTPFDSTVLALRRDVDRAEVERLADAGASSAQVLAILT